MAMRTRPHDKGDSATADQEVSLRDLIREAGQDQDLPSPPGPDAPASRWARITARTRARAATGGQAKVRRPRDAAQWSGGSQLATRATTGALAVCLLAGPIALVKGMTSSPAPVAAGAGYDDRMMNRRAAAIDTAQEAIPAWLGATTSNSAALARWWDTSNMQLPGAATGVSDVTVRSATPTAPGVWTVQVGADVTPPGGTTRRRYFQIPIAVSGTGPQIAAAPLTLPAEVAAPSLQVTTSTQYDTPIPSTSDAFTMTSGFLSALLAGHGPIALYTRPGVSIPPVSPAPWVQATLSALAADSGDAARSGAPQPDGTRIRVLATVALTAPATTPQPPAATSPSGAPSSTQATDTPVSAQYELVLTMRAGRWEISALDPAPVLSTPSQQQHA